MIVVLNCDAVIKDVVASLSNESRTTVRETEDRRSIKAMDMIYKSV